MKRLVFGLLMILATVGMAKDLCDIGLSGKTQKIATQYHNMGNELFYKEKYKNSISCLKKALKIELQLYGKNDNYVASEYHNISVDFFALKKYKKSLSYALKALQIRKKILYKYNSNLGSSYRQVANNYFMLGHKQNFKIFINKFEKNPKKIKIYNYFDKAIKYYQKVLAIDKKIDNLNDKKNAFIYCNMGAIYYFYKRNNKKALPYFLKAIKIEQGAIPSNWRPSQGNLSYWIAEIYFKNREYKKALKYYKKFFSQKDIYMGFDFGMAYNHFGSLNLSLGNYKEALRYFNKSLIYSQDENLIRVAVDYNNIGEVYVAKGDIYKGLDSYRKAYEIKKQIYGDGVNKNSTTLINNIALLYVRIGNYDKALEYVKKISLSSNNSIADEQLYENTLGTIYLHLKQFNKSEIHFLKALKLCKKTPIFKDRIATGYDNLSVLYLKAKKYTKALQFNNKALNIRKEIFKTNHPDIAVSYNNIGAIYHEQEKYKEALKFYGKSLEIRKKVLGEEHLYTAQSYNNIGGLYFETKDYKSSYSYFKKSYNIFIKNRDRIFKVLNNQQKKLFLSSEENKEKVPSFLLSASAYIKQDSSIKSKVSKEVMDSWLLYKGSIFDNENAIAMLRGSTKDRTLKAKIDKLLSMQRALAKLYQSYPKKGQRDAWKQRIKELESSIDSIKREIASKSTKFREKFGLDNINHKDIAKYLKSDELYIDYAYTEDGCYLFTIDSKANVRFIKIDKSDSKEIDRLVKSFRDSVDNIIDTKLSKEELEKLTTKDKKRLNRLYTLVLGKYIDEAIKDKSSLVISPDGALRLLPFEALIKDGKYLIELKDISYIASGREFVRVNRYAKGKVSKAEADIFANPDFYYDFFSNNNKAKELNSSRYNLLDSLGEKLGAFIPASALNNTKKEAKEVETILDKESYKIDRYMGKDANEYNLLKVKRPKVLHISTHGFFINSKKIKNPMLKAGLLLAGANKSYRRSKDYGIVTALKLLQLNLEGTDLVVLSACNTGVVDINSTDSVSALGKAFIQAGAKNVVMSLWSVDDNQTANLMSNFYKEQLNKKDYKKALRDAKLKMINQNLHPAYWSAFVISGE